MAPDRKSRSSAHRRSHATVLAVGDRFQVRELSEVEVKGRLESVRVYAVDGELHAGSSAANPAASEGGHG